MRNKAWIFQEGHCKFHRNLSVVNITSWAILPAGDEKALEAAVATIGPIAASINAMPKTFQLYQWVPAFYLLSREKRSTTVQMTTNEQMTCARALASRNTSAKCAIILDTCHLRGYALHISYLNPRSFAYTTRTDQLSIFKGGRESGSTSLRDVRELRRFKALDI